MQTKKYKIFPSDVLLVILATLIVWWGNSTVTPFLPLLAKSVNFTLIETSIFLGIMGFARFFAQPFLGKILSVNDEIIIIRIVFIMLLLSSLGYLLSDNFYILMLCRILEAIAFASFAIVVRMIINSNLSFDKISIINNYYSGAQNLGRFIGPALAGFIIANMGIKYIFLATCILYVLGSLIALAGKGDDSQISEKKEPIGSINIFNKRLIIFLLLYSLEFVGLGLWLSSWSIYAINVLRWNVLSVGISFSILAVSSVAIIPFLNRISSIHLQRKIIIGVFLLSFQPIAVIVFKGTPVMMWLSFILGGMGATLYFSTFHTYVSKCIQGKKIAIFYGFVGSFSFAGQAVGQSIAPLLSHYYSYSVPIFADFLILVLDLFLYMLFFLTMDLTKSHED